MCFAYDIGETQGVAAKHPEVIARMEQIMATASVRGSSRSSRWHMFRIAVGHSLGRDVGNAGVIGIQGKLAG